MRDRWLCTALLLLACSGDAPRPQPGPPDSAAPSPVTPETADVIPEINPLSWTVRDTVKTHPVAGAATLAAVRTAAQAGFDRVVFDFGETALPGYRIEYVDRPQHECGSGREVRLPGDAWLSVIMQPANAHTDAGLPTVRERARVTDLPNLLQLRLTCDFEAVVEWVLAVRSPAGYRVLELHSPSRLVVDLRHP